MEAATAVAAAEMTAEAAVRETLEGGLFEMRAVRPPDTASAAVDRGAIDDDDEEEEEELDDMMQELLLMDQSDHQSVNEGSPGPSVGQWVKQDPAAVTAAPRATLTHTSPAESLRSTSAEVLPPPLQRRRRE